MMSEENQNQENIIKENPVSAEPKQEVVESVPVVPADTEVLEDKEEIPTPIEVTTEEITQTEQVETPEVVESITEPVEEMSTTEPTKTEQNDTGLPRSSAVAPELAKTTEEIGQPQEIPTQPQIQTVEKIIYQTPPNFIQNLLNKARAKIQEKKRKKLDKIMSLFESNSEISNSDVRNLLRTARRSTTRYLDILEKEQKITQVGSIGKGVKYIKK